MAKNAYLDTKISLLQHLGAKLHLEEVLKHVVGIVVGVDAHLAVLKMFTINLTWSKIYNWTPKSMFHL